MTTNLAPRASRLAPRASRLAPRASRLALYWIALITGGVVSATEARGQTWTGELVYEGASSSIPLSGVIRNWGPDDLVYVFYERFEEGASETNAELSRWSCSNNDGCATETHVATAWATR